MKHAGARWLVYGIVANWIVFWLVGWKFGTAPGGKIEGSHFFLGNHGYFIEVSRLVFVASAAWTYASMLALCSLWFIDRWVRRSGTRSDDGSSDAAHSS